MPYGVTAPEKVKRDFPSYLQHKVSLSGECLLDVRQVVLLPLDFFRGGPEIVLARYPLVRRVQSGQIGFVAVYLCIECSGCSHPSDVPGWAFVEKNTRNRNHRNRFDVRLKQK